MIGVAVRRIGQRENHRVAGKVLTPGANTASQRQATCFRGVKRRRHLAARMPDYLFRKRLRLAVRGNEEYSER